MYVECMSNVLRRLIEGRQVVESTNDFHHQPLPAAMIGGDRTSQYCQFLLLELVRNGGDFLAPVGHHRRLGHAGGVKTIVEGFDLAHVLGIAGPRSDPCEQAADETRRFAVDRCTWCRGAATDLAFCATERQKKKLGIPVVTIGQRGRVDLRDMEAVAGACFDQGFADQKVQPGIAFRLGGLVARHSVRHGADADVSFAVTDGRGTVPVHYHGVLPALFREGQGVVATGALDPGGTFVASEVLAKHDEKYMPPEVVDALKRSGRWKEGGT